MANGIICPLMYNRSNLEMENKHITTSNMDKACSKHSRNSYAQNASQNLINRTIKDK